MALRFAQKDRTRFRSLHRSDNVLLKLKGTEIKSMITVKIEQMNQVVA